MRFTLNRSTIAVASVLFIALATWLIMSTRDANGRTLEPGSHASKEPDGRQTRGPEAVRSEARAKPGTPTVPPDRGSALIFVDAESGQPIVGVRLYRSRANGSAIRLDPNAGIGRSDARGRIDSNTFADLPTGSLFAYAPGYFIARIPVLETTTRQTEVRMQRSRTTLISCRTPAGRPASGCSVFVARRQYHRPLTIQSPWIGQPDAKQPVWGAITSDDGLASIQGLPPGAYRVHVFSCRGNAWAQSGQRLNYRTGHGALV